METKATTKGKITRFLLGDLSFEEREEIEIALLDEEVFEQYLAVEGELVEKYLAGTLPPRESEMLVSNYLTTERGRAQLEACKALAAYLDAQRFHASPDAPARANAAEAPDGSKRLRPVPSWWASTLSVARGLAYSIVVLLIVLTVINGYFALNFAFNWQSSLESNTRAEQELQELRKNVGDLQQQLEAQKSQQDDLRAQLAEAQKLLAEEAARSQGRGSITGRSAQPALSTFISLFYGGQGRGPDVSAAHKLGPEVGRVTFALNFPVDKNLVRVARVTIRPIDGGGSWSTSRQLHVEPADDHRRVVVRDVPAHFFSTGDYVLSLSGSDDQGRPVSLEFPVTIQKDRQP